jgi:hypothetical protein
LIVYNQEERNISLLINYNNPNPTPTPTPTPNQTSSKSSIDWVAFAIAMAGNDFYIVIYF